jgi:uncharacterized HAD superfamily protein
VDNNQQILPNKIFIRDTSLFVPFDYTTDHYETLSKILIFDTMRNQQIVQDVLHEVGQQKKILVLTERKEHLHVLQLYLKGKCEVISLS